MIRSKSRSAAFAALAVAVFPFAVAVEHSAANKPDRPAHAVGSELASARTAFTSTWRGEEGKRIVRLGTTPLNWKNRRGKWQPLDLGLHRASGGSRDIAQVADAEVSLPGTQGASRAVVVDDGRGAEVRLELEGSRAVKPVRTTDQVREFRGVLPGVAQRMTVTESGIKEDLILANRRSPRRFSYRLRLSAGLVPVLKSNGVLDVHRGSAVVFSIPRAVLYEQDRPGERVNGAQYRIERTADREWRLVVDADGSWIRHTDRRWPVVVDPTVVVYRLSPSIVCRFDFALAGESASCATTSTDGSVGPEAATAKVGWEARGGSTLFEGYHWLGVAGFPLPGPLLDGAISQAMLHLTATDSLNTTGKPQRMIFDGATLVPKPGGPPQGVPKFTTQRNVDTVPGTIEADVTREVRTWRQMMVDPLPPGETRPTDGNRGFRLRMDGMPARLAGPVPAPGVACNGWTFGGGTPGMVCDQNWVSIATQSHPNPTVRPYLDVSTAAPAQAGSEIESPAEGKLTSRFVELRAAAASESVSSAKFEYVAGESREWQDVPLAALRYKTSGKQPTSSAIAVGDQRSTRLVWDLDKTPGAEVDGPIHVRALLDAGEAHGGGATPERNFRLDRKNPETSSHEEVGPAKVDLLTGDVGVTEKDVDVPAFVDDLQLTRTYHSRGGSPRTADMFGPGWTGSFEVDGGEMPYRGIYNFTDIKETEEIVDWAVDDSNVDWEYFDPADLIFEPVYETTRFETTYAVLEKTDGSKISFRKDGASWVVDQERSDLKITQTGTGFTVKDADGGVTVFDPDKPGSPNYRPVSYAQAGSSKNTTFQYAIEGGRRRIKRIVAPVVGSVTCTGATLPAGCRALDLVWVDKTVAGKTEKRVEFVNLLAHDPSGQDAVTSRPVAKYEYDSSGRLVKVSDPRVSGGLPTEYAYDAEGRLETYMPSGERPWTFAYQAIDGDSGTGRVRGITRKTPAGTDATTTFVYNVPLSGSGAPKDLSPSAVATWGQTDRPQTGTAIFPPDAVPSGSGMPTSWARATINYVGIHGQTVNVADPEGNVTTSEFDKNGNVVRALTARNRERVLASSAPATRSHELDTQYEYAANGVDRIREVGPEHSVRQRNGTPTLARQFTTTTYDQGKPTSVPGDQHLATEVRVGGYRTSDKLVIDEDVTKHEYSDGTNHRGWAVKQPLKTTVGFGTADAATTSYAYDTAYPLLIQKRMPKAGAGMVSQATNYTYYGVTTPLAGSSWCSSGAGLANSAAAGGLLCAKMLDAQPTSGPDVPGTFFRYGTLWSELEERRATAANNVAGTTLRTTTTQRDALGRETNLSTTGTGRAIPAVSSTYHGSTGRLATTTSAALGGEPARSLQRTYDDNGRLSTYVDADGGTTIYAYDLAGRTTSIQDPRGTRGLVYDDRDLVSGIVDSTLSAPITAERNADGQLTEQTLPGGLVQTKGYNENGDPDSLDWTKTSGCASDCAWVTSAVTRDVQGRVATQSSATADQTYTYDGVGRIASAEERRAGRCVVRTYGYDKNSNRSSLVIKTSDPGGACGTGATVTKNTTVDGVDRVKDTGYAYDALGRTTTLPASDAPGGTATTLTYDVDDLVASTTAGTATQAITRDPTGRLRSETSQADGMTTATSTTRYGSDEDDPTGRTGAWGWERYIADVDGSQLATVSDGGSVGWELSDLHGDVVATASGSGSAPTSGSAFDEFGNRTASVGTPVAKGLRHAWLGGYGKGSAFTAGGLIHMGVRVYNPAIGRFLQVDPVEGGSANTYDYVDQDPVNELDLAGDCPVCIGAALAARAIAGRLAARAAAARAAAAKAATIRAKRGVTINGPNGRRVKVAVHKHAGGPHQERHVQINRWIHGGNRSQASVKRYNVRGKRMP